MKNTLSSCWFIETNGGCLARFLGESAPSGLRPQLLQAVTLFSSVFLAQISSMHFMIRVSSVIEKVFHGVSSLLDVETDVTHVWFKSKQAPLVLH